MTTPFAWQPDDRIVAEATLTAFIARHGLTDYDALMDRSTADPEWFWEAVIDPFGIAFTTPYDRVMDSRDGLPWTRWCVGGETNLASPELNDPTVPAIDAARIEGVYLRKGVAPIPNVRAVGELDDRLELRHAEVDIHSEGEEAPRRFVVEGPIWLGLNAGMMLDLTHTDGDR